MAEQIKPKNVILIGFMGTGKSSIGKLLAQKLKWNFVDTDSLIGKSAGMTISEIFTKKGEPKFRDMESDILQQVLSKENQVISTGGGIVLREENMNRMKQNGIIIALSATPEIIFARTRHRKTRPVLGDEPTLDRVKEILNFRSSLYAQADFSINTSALSKDKIITLILDFLKTL